MAWIEAAHRESLYTAEQPVAAGGRRAGQQVIETEVRAKGQIGTCLCVQRHFIAEHSASVRRFDHFHDRAEQAALGKGGARIDQNPPVVTICLHQAVYDGCAVFLAGGLPRQLRL